MMNMNLEQDKTERTEESFPVLSINTVPRHGARREQPSSPGWNGKAVQPPRRYAGVVASAAMDTTARVQLRPKHGADWKRSSAGEVSLLPQLGRENSPFHRRLKILANPVLCSFSGLIRNECQPVGFGSFPPRGKVGMGAINWPKTLFLARPHPGPPPWGEGKKARFHFG